MTMAGYNVSCKSWKEKLQSTYSPDGAVFLETFQINYPCCYGIGKKLPMHDNKNILFLLNGISFLAMPTLI